ncbi:MAG: DNA polymerase III subunit alpha, partial [Chloroflexi bacterium]|nr:DNA polymerase III subunit alpha [Chloroflexota bacterium]
LKSAQEMHALFRDIPEALTNTHRIAEMTDLHFTFGQLNLPDFPVPEDHTVESWLREECQRGLATRYGTVTEEIQRRLDYELDVIIRMGYAGYFLIVADFTRFAREHGIATTCRGSAPGSLVTYTLGITPVDPIRYELPFERFLNPDRVTMPDIDVDFEDSRRDEVIGYVTRKYGFDHVAQIITFGTMLARAAIRDVGRVLGLGYGEVDRIAKAVPNQLGIKLDEAIQMAAPLREMQEADPQVRKLLDLAKQVEGVARNASTHAAGVVISRDPLTDLMPLQRATNSDALMTQYEMHGVEALGLLKFDFLGLSNLTILRQAVDLIHATRPDEPRIDLDDLPLEDARTFELLASGETTGIFQLESAGMRRYIRELRPTSVHDLAAMVALYRPGPMDNIPAYIRRKHGQEPVTYLHPLLEPYLAKTYGIFVYQEDIMSAAKALGGFTGPEADTLCYAIRKKKSSVLRAQREKFVRQAAERGVTPQVIDAVFAAFQPFERYGFNKAHATCYGLIAYQTAYLKANYTVEYMASVLTALRDNTDRVAAAIAECRRLGIEVRTPSVHGSGLHFTVEDDAIRFGLLAIKNVGEGAIESVVRAREADGPFRSLTDFCCRVDLRLTNKRVLESLIRVGALNDLGHPAQLLMALDDALASGQATQRDRISGQSSLFDLVTDAGPLERPLPEATEAPPRERLRWEKELLGLYLSDHPLGELAGVIGGFVTAYSGDLGEEMDQQRIVVGGVVTGVRRVITKTKSTMAVATLEDLQGTLDVVVFPKVLETTAERWQEDAILLVAGRVDHKGEETVLLADAVWTWEEAIALGKGSFGAAVAAGDRGRRGSRYGAGPPVGSNGRRMADVTAGTRPLAGPGNEEADPAPVRVRVIPRVSPLRDGSVTGSITVTLGGPLQSRAPEPRSVAAEPASVAAEPASVAALATDHEEPPFPDEERQRLVSDEQAPTAPLHAQPGQSLHVRFSRAANDVVLPAFETLRELIHQHPGDTPVVLHIPAGPSREQLMELRRGIAYDAEFLAAVRRRLGEGLVRLELAAGR